jgi:tetratricopeptide (TPR) repeat protein
MAREKFKAVIDGGDSPLVDEARLELAEVYSQRDEDDAAIDLLKDAIAKDPESELAERLKVRLAQLQLSKGDVKAAASLANEILILPKSSYAAYARAIAVEAAYEQKNWASVVDLATPIFQATRGIGRMNGVSDHAILRMADAQGQMGKWKEARATLDTWLARFPRGSSSLSYEAKFSYGWVCENLKDVESAVTAYAEVAARIGGELGAKSNLQVGRLRMEQGRPAAALSPLLAVAYAYDDPELSPAAMVEAAKAMVKLNKPDGAKRILERAVREYGSSKWADAAKKQLGEMK